MLMASFFVLLSVILPHHHREDGQACYALLQHIHDAETGGEDHADHSSSENTAGCDCNGHNPAFYTAMNHQYEHADVHLFLFPLLVFFDYIYPPEPRQGGTLTGNEQLLFTESLYDAWVVSATGLRAPPVA